MPDHLDPRTEAWAQLLERAAGYRVLRAVPAPHSKMPDDGVPPRGYCIGLVDLETSGLDPEQHKIIELALMLAWVDEAGHVIAHCGPVSWLEDPGEPLDPRITLITGLAAQHLAGKRINDPVVEGMLSRADCLVAHNTRFEVSWLERRYPRLKGWAWGCSMADIDWLMAGCDGRAQQSLLAQHGLFSDAHRAGADVWSLFLLLNQRRREVGPGPARTHLQRLLETVRTPTTLVEARGAPIGKKDLLKARGYRWNPGERVWAKELPDEEVPHEQAWFFRHGLPAPVTRTVTAHERHR